VESHGEQGLLAQHSLETTSKLDLADGESVTQMQRSVHIGIRERSHPLGLLSSDLGWRRCLAGDRLEVGASRSRSIDLEEVLLGPSGLSLAFELDEVVSLGSLCIERDATVHQLEHSSNASTNIP
jgi:hypothetical protein